MDDTTRRKIKAGTWKSATAWRDSGRHVVKGAEPRGHARAGRHTYPVYEEWQTEPVNRRQAKPPRQFDWTEIPVVLSAIEKARRNLKRRWKSLPDLIDRGIRFVYSRGGLSVVGCQDGTTIYEGHGYLFKSYWRPRELHGLPPEQDECSDVPMRLRDAVALLESVPDCRDGWLHSKQ